MAGPFMGRMPVLCVDTCSVLDILRDPTREKFGADDARTALFLIDAFASGAARCIAAEQVLLEYAEHADSVQSETEKALGGFLRRIRHIHDLAITLGATDVLEVSSMLGHAVRGRGVADRFLSLAESLPTEDDIVMSAYRRVADARTPARRSKESFKDCLVVETYLKFARLVRASGHGEPIVFVSSNTTDYMPQGGRELGHDIAREFEALDIRFAPNLPAARHWLGLAETTLDPERPPL